MIGHRLRTARAAAGLSLRDLESKIDNLVTAQALSKYEQDEMMPGSQVLIAIAKALGVSEDYLLSEQEMSLDGVEFRKKAKMSAKEQAQVEAQVLHLFERYLAVEELLGLTIEWDKPREAPYPVLNDVNEADRAARESASRLGSWTRSSAQSGRAAGRARHQDFVHRGGQSRRTNGEGFATEPDVVACHRHQQ